jgi:hypothetical protein
MALGEHPGRVLPNFEIFKKKLVPKIQEKEICGCLHICCIFLPSLGEKGVLFWYIEKSLVAVCSNKNSYLWPKFIFSVLSKYNIFFIKL